MKYLINWFILMKIVSWILFTLRCESRTLKYLPALWFDLISKTSNMYMSDFVRQIQIPWLPDHFRALPYSELVWKLTPFHCASSQLSIITGQIPSKNCEKCGKRPLVRALRVTFWCLSDRLESAKEFKTSFRLWLSPSPSAPGGCE